MTDALTDEPVPSARALLKERDYLLFWGTRWTGSFASQIQSVAMGWQMYALARQTRSVEESAFLVGMIGLAAFVPVFLLTLPAGEAADRYDRKKVLLLCLSGEILSVLALAIASAKHSEHLTSYARPCEHFNIAAPRKKPYRKSASAFISQPYRAIREEIRYHFVCVFVEDHEVLFKA